MPININDCHGDKKKHVVDTYFLTPLAHMRLIPGQIKHGCCGQLTERYVIFSYTGIKDKSDRGTFFVGIDCAKQMLDLINEKKLAASKTTITLPPLFDPTRNGFAVYDENEYTSINRDIVELISMIASVWDIQRFEGRLPYLLQAIKRFPLQSVSKKDILGLNSIVSRDHIITSGKAMNFRDRLEREGLFVPELLSLRGALELLHTEGELEAINI